MLSLLTSATITWVGDLQSSNLFNHTFSVKLFPLANSNIQYWSWHLFGSLLLPFYPLLPPPPPHTHTPPLHNGDLWSEPWSFHLRYQWWMWYQQTKYFTDLICDSGVDEMFFSFNVWEWDRRNIFLIWYVRVMWTQCFSGLIWESGVDTMFFWFDMGEWCRHNVFLVWYGRVV